MSAASARDHAPLPEEGGLRTALRNVPMLPAPANVDDLLARLEAEEVPFASGPLASLISDARVVEEEPAPEDDGFFAPVATAANSNVAPPFPSWLRNGLFGAGLLAGALLIGWNALMTSEEAAPSDPHIVVEIKPIALGVASQSAPEGQAKVEEPVPQTPTHVDAAEPVPLAEPEPQLPPVPTISELILEGDARQPIEAVAPTDAIRLPEPPEAAPPLSAEIMLAQAPPPPLLMALPVYDPMSGAPEPVSPPIGETLASLQPHEVVVPLPPEPVRDAEISAGETLPSPAPAFEAAPAASQIEAEASTSAHTVAAAPPIESHAHAQVRSVAVASRPSLRRPKPTPTDHKSSATAAAAPAAAIRPKTARAAYTGVWAATPEACSPETQEKEGHLLTRISASRARAGDASCAFKRIRGRGNVWTMTATCTDGESTWTSDVRLSLSRGRLTWSSQKGSTTYMRCPRA